MLLRRGEILDMWEERLGRPNYLYVLIDPRDDKVCYVGITMQSFQDRLNQHRNPVRGNNTRIAKLQKHLKSIGLTIQGEVLAKGSEEFISILEKYCISGFWKYLGKDSLKNHLIGGRDSFGIDLESLEKRRKTTLERKKQGFYESREGEKSSSNKLTEYQILEIYKLIRQFYSNSEILDMLELDIGLTGLNQIRHGKSWKYLWEQEGMIVIPSLKKEKGGLSSPNKIKVLTDIENGTSIEDIKQRYQLQTTDIKRIKDKILWKPVWDIYNNYFKIN